MLNDLLNHLMGGSANRVMQEQTDGDFNALVERNNAFARMIGAEQQAIPESLDQVRIRTQIVPGILNQFQNGQPTFLSNGQNMVSSMLATQAVSPQAAPTQQSLLNTWQAGYQQQAQQQQAEVPQTTPPAQMSLGQVQPAAQSASATNSYPGQRFQQSSLGGLNWSQQGQGQQQGQPNNQQPLQTGQQSMGGRYGQRRQQGLGMLGQQIIA